MPFCQIDDKHVPIHRVLWISDLPHFCGSPECQREGQYEICLGQGESVWGNREERDALMAAIDAWQERGGT
jgi:hypothetical protein